MHGIKETKELLKFAIEFGEAFDKALMDGKIGLEDALFFYQAVTAAAPGFQGIDKVPAELGDMDEAERQELKDYVEQELDIANDKLEEVIEQGLATALQIYKMVELVKGLKKEEPAQEAPVSEEPQA